MQRLSSLMAMSEDEEIQPEPELVSEEPEMITLQELIREKDLKMDTAIQILDLYDGVRDACLEAADSHRRKQVRVKLALNEHRGVKQALEQRNIDEHRVKEAVRVDQVRVVDDQAERDKGIIGSMKSENVTRKWKASKEKSLRQQQNKQKLLERLTVRKTNSAPDPNVVPLYSPRQAAQTTVSAPATKTARTAAKKAISDRQNNFLDDFKRIVTNLSTYANIERKKAERKRTIHLRTKASHYPHTSLDKTLLQLIPPGTELKDLFGGEELCTPKTVLKAISLSTNREEFEGKITDKNLEIFIKIMKSNGGYSKYVNPDEHTKATIFEPCLELSDVWDDSHAGDWGYLFKYFVMELAAEDGDGVHEIDGGAEKALDPDILATYLDAWGRPGKKKKYGGGRY